MEYHYRRGSGDQAANDDVEQPSAREMLSILQRLQQRGLRAFNIEPNYWCALWDYGPLARAILLTSGHVACMRASDTALHALLERKKQAEGAMCE